MQVVGPSLLVPSPLSPDAAASKEYVDAGGGGLSSSRNVVLGDGAATSFDIDHDLGADALVVQAWEIATGFQIPVAPLVLDANNIRVTFVDPPAVNGVRVVILTSGGIVPQPAPSGDGGSGNSLIGEATSIARNLNITNTGADLDSLSIDFTVREGHPVLVETFLPWVTIAVAGAGAVVSIVDLANGAVTGMGSTFAAVAGAAYSLTAEERIWEPGDYSRKVRLMRYLGSGTVSNGYNPPSDALTSRLSIFEQ